MMNPLLINLFHSSCISHLALGDNCLNLFLHNLLLTAILSEAQCFDIVFRSTGRVMDIKNFLSCFGELNHCSKFIVFKLGRREILLRIASFWDLLITLKRFLEVLNIAFEH